MTLTTAFTIIFRAAESHANGSENSAAILAAIKKCKEALNMNKRKNVRMVA